ncbi:MAG: hypothetical protein ACYDCT_02450 [Dehalococcoidia bacterium]
MTEQRPGRRRRGRRGGQGRQRDEAQAPPAGTPPGPPGPPGPPRGDAAGPAAGGEPATEPGARRRQDTRRSRRGAAASAPPPEVATATPNRIHRRPPEAPAPRQTRGRDRDGKGRDRDRDRGPRSFEPPVPQDERSIELGARFRETQNALRDARKTLDKRKAEHGDEPQWLLDEYAAAEERYAALATEWAEHLATTGRKVGRR